jgi:hypothetical protein
MSATKFHTHTKQQAKLYFCISIIIFSSLFVVFDGGGFGWMDDREEQIGNLTRRCGRRIV